MERNPNSWRLLSIFFAMAMLFALGSVSIVSASVDKTDQEMFVNLPPGQEIIAITLIENLQIIDQASETYLIARGVSVPYKGLIKDVEIYNSITDFQCNICYTISKVDLKPDILNGFRQEIDKYPFAGDLGLRYAPSVMS